MMVIMMMMIVMVVVVMIEISFITLQPKESKI
jgi:hypothetical protein